MSSNIQVFVVFGYLQECRQPNYWPFGKSVNLVTTIFLPHYCSYSRNIVATLESTRPRSFQYFFLSFLSYRCLQIWLQRFMSTFNWRHSYLERYIHVLCIYRDSITRFKIAVCVRSGTNVIRKLVQHNLRRAAAWASMYPASRASESSALLCPTSISTSARFRVMRCWVPWPYLVGGHRSRVIWPSIKYL